MHLTVTVPLMQLVSVAAVVADLSLSDMRAVCQVNYAPPRPGDVWPPAYTNDKNKTPHDKGSGDDKQATGECTRASYRCVHAPMIGRLFVLSFSAILTVYLDVLCCALDACSERTKGKGDAGTAPIRERPDAYCKKFFIANVSFEAQDDDVIAFFNTVAADQISQVIRVHYLHVH